VHSKGQSDARTRAYEHDTDIPLYKELQLGRVADEMRRSSGRSGGRESLPQYLPARLARSLVTYRPIRWSGVCARYLNETGDMVITCGPNPEYVSTVDICRSSRVERAGLVLVSGKSAGFVRMLIGEHASLTVHGTGYGHGPAHLLSVVAKCRPVVVNDKQDWAPSVFHCMRLGRGGGSRVKVQVTNKKERSTQLSNADSARPPCQRRFVFTLARGHVILLGQSSGTLPNIPVTEKGSMAVS